MRCVWVVVWTQSHVAHPVLSQHAGTPVKLQEQEDALQHRGNGNQSVAVAISFLTILTAVKANPRSQNGVKRVLPEQECPDATMAT